MAKRVASSKRTSTSRKSKSGASASGTARSTNSNWDYKGMLRGWYEAPAFKYVAGGVGLAVISRVAMNMSSRYPQITTFFRDNMEIIESKLSEFRSGSSEVSESENARH